MRRILLALVLAGIVVCGAVGLVIAVALDPPAPLAAPDRGAQFDSVILIEPGGERRGPVSLHIEGGRIRGIGPAIESGADPYAGAFVLPGFTDLHAHFPMTGFPGDEEYTALLFLLHGVTTVRLTGGADPQRIASWRERVTSGEVAGPRFYSCGPIIDGPDPVLPGNRFVSSPAEARALVAELAEAGVDCIKAYDRLDLPSVAALREAAHAHGLPIVGHTPQEVSFEDARLDDVQHLRGVHPPFADEARSYPHFLAVWQRLDDGWLEHVVEVSRRHGITHTPTLSAVEATLRAEDWERWRATPEMQLWLPQLRDAIWSGEVGFNPRRFSSDADLQTVRDATVAMGRTALALHRAGIELHTGTDSNAPNLVPGAALHREFELWVRAGIPLEATLEASTRVSPQFLGIDDAGSLRTGAPADLVLLRADPTRDLAALGSIAAVVRDGRLYSREDLQARVARYRAHYGGFAFGDVLMPLLRRALATISGLLREDQGVQAAFLEDARVRASGQIPEGSAAAGGPSQVAGTTSCSRPAEARVATVASRSRSGCS